MGRILFVHWNEPDADRAVKRLRDAGHDVIVESKDAHTAWNRIRQEVVDLVAISLDKSSLGLTAATGIADGQLRRIPLVLVGGSRADRDRARSDHPDAFFTSWAALADVVEALLNPDISQPSPGAGP